MARTKTTVAKPAGAPRGTTKKAPKAGKTVATAGADGGEAKARKPHRYHPGTVSLREIRRYQRSTDLLMRKSPVQRVIRQIAQTSAGPEVDVRFQRSAILALHEACESYLTGLFANANTIAIHSKRVTVEASDLLLAKELKGF